jgi:hypothetical protein
MNEKYEEKFPFENFCRKKPPGKRRKKELKQIRKKKTEQIIAKRPVNQSGLFHAEIGTLNASKSGRARSYS